MSRVRHKIVSPPVKVCEILTDLADMRWGMDSVWARVDIRVVKEKARYNCRCQLEAGGDGMVSLQSVELTGYEFSEFEDVGDGTYWIGFCDRCAMVYWGRT